MGSRQKAETTEAEEQGRFVVVMQPDGTSFNQVRRICESRRDNTAGFAVQGRIKEKMRSVFSLLSDSLFLSLSLAILSRRTPTEKADATQGQQMRYSRQTDRSRYEVDRRKWAIVDNSKKQAANRAAQDYCMENHDHLRRSGIQQQV